MKSYFKIYLIKIFYDSSESKQVPTPKKKKIHKQETLEAREEEIQIRKQRQKGKKKSR